MTKNLAIYQAENGAIELKLDENQESFWASQKQIADIFSVDVKTINEHIRNIYNSEELKKKSTIWKFQIVQKEGNRDINREVFHYNLDMVISIGYRVNSKTATKFRIWATKTLKQHITKGYTINKNLLNQKKDLYLKALEDIKILSQKNNLISNEQIIELIKTFSSTWFNLESYDKQNLPKQGENKQSFDISFKNLTQELYGEIAKLKKDLIIKKEATDFFAQEKKENSLEGILGNVFQSAFGKDVYETIEEKASHLLYFIIKNHYFIDGNKRSGAFSFIWFLQKMKFDFSNKITPETLTVLTLLIAESNPKDKEKMIGLVLLILNNKK
jgi:prophage maintenance system killer protein